jgi:glycosyltransferase involved in cell wall biosynthesis
VSAPVVTVVIPVYNTVDHLQECLDSVLGQTLADLEVLCVDDGSTDGSLEVMERYTGEDPRVTVVRRDGNDRGPGAARNLAIERATGAYLAFVDSDDRIRPTMLEALVAAADRLGADVSMCMLQTFDETGEHATACSYDQVIPQELDRAAFTWQDLGTDLFKLRFASCNKVYARSFLERQGVRYSEDRYYEDLIFTFRALLEARALTFVREPLYLNRKGREEATTYVQGDRVMDAITSLEELQDLIEQDEAYTGLAAAFHAFAFRKMLVYLAQVDADHIDAFYAHLRAVANRPQLDGTPELSEEAHRIRERIVEQDLKGFLAWYVWYLQHRHRRISRRLAQAQAQRLEFRDRVRRLQDENRRLRERLAERSAKGLVRRLLGRRGTAVVRRLRR